MEKPIAVSVEEAFTLERAVRKAGVKYLIGLCNRLTPGGAAGQAVVAVAVVELWAVCGLSISAQACHNLDLIVHLFYTSAYHC